MTLHNLRRIASLTRTTVLGLGALALLSSNAAAQQTVNLIAAPLTKVVSLPNGTAVGVPMWGFAFDGDVNGNGVQDVGEALPNGLLDGAEAPTVPGPRITVPPGTGTLTINLTNLLPEPVSIVIPGQQASGSPVLVGGRVRSMAPEASAGGGSASYVFTSLRPGTFLYESGSHQAVQVQMGLYGAVTMDAVAGEAYAGVPYANEVLLLYSEIDVALHNAVADGTYGTPPGPTSTIDYAPSIFLVNGNSYTGSTPALPAGSAGQRTLLRMLSAGLGNHAVVVDNASLSLVAEDGNKYGDARTQATVLLPAGKTHDAIWAPTAAGDYTVYDRTLHLQALNQASGGMLAKLHIGEAGGGPAPTVAAAPDAFGLTEDSSLPVDAARNVLTNDTGAGLTAELYGNPSAGALTLNANGTFSYVPQPNFSGVDSFSYRAVSGIDRSAPVQVTLTVAPLQDAPTAFPLALGVNSGEGKPITLSGFDPDSDLLTFQVTQLPAPNGTLSIVDPVTLIRRDLVAADLNVTPIPAGTLTYTPTGVFVGESIFMFRAADGLGFSTPAAVTMTVHPLESTAAAGTPLTLNVVGSDGAAISAYYWTLEEDLTYEVVPSVLDPNTLSVSFHRSYVPVVQSGDQSTPPLVDPTKRYFISVLPKSGAYSNSGAPIARGQTSVNLTVNAGPLPTGQLTVHVFEDNGSLNGVLNTTEPGLEGFAVMIADTGGQKGHSAAQQIQDVFGNPIGTTYKACTNPLGCTSYEVDQVGQGFVLTDAAGFANFKNLPAGMYEVFVIPPTGTTWVQGIQTVEGGKPIEAWVKPNEPPFFSEFGPPGPHVVIGFVRPTNDTTFLGAGAGPFSTITGQVTNLHMSRTPIHNMFSGAPFDFTRAWVALQVGAGEYGAVVYIQPADEEGNFSIAGVPSGAYKLIVFDTATNFIAATKAITVNAPAALELGTVPVFHWFNRHYSYVFEDLNQNGFRDAGERGIPEVATNLRWRDGSIYQSYPTDVNGFVPYEQIFPFMNWLIAEVDYTRFKATGVTVVVDGGGDPNLNTSWPAQVGAELDSRVLAPQPQSENGNAPFRTETGPVLLEAFQGFMGQSNVMLWGKAPFAVPGSVPPDVNLTPFDDFPGPGDTDGNSNGKFDVDMYHGGIAGIVHYSTTRAENLARWGTPEMWEPGIAGVRVQLWDATRTRLLNEATTDSWDDSQPTGCQGPVFTYLGRATDCYDGLRNWNQVRPGVFDGGWAFFTQKEPLVDAMGNIVPIDQRTIEKPLPAGKYVVKVIVPPGYKIVKEEDKNVDFGEEYIPAQFLLTGYPLADAGAADPAPARPREMNDNLASPFCVGALHTVPAELSLFPGLPGPYAGDQIPLCDEKLVILRNGQDTAQPNFFLFTEAPVSGHIVGIVMDDTANEFDPNSPNYSEKYGPPWVPVSIHDWTGREITRTYSDRNGAYNALVPSTFTAQLPQPSGVGHMILQACINTQLMPGPGGTMVPDPLHNNNYSEFCYPFQFMPGKTTYLDTPVLPTGAFTGQPGLTTVDAELPNLTPVIHSVNGPGSIGPYVVPQAGDLATRTITIFSAGTVLVPNPAYDDITASIPKEIARDYGFGALTGQVLVGTSTVVLPILSWSNTVITAEVPVGTPTGQLRVIRCLAAPCTTAANLRESVLGVTLTVATPDFHAARPPLTVPVGTSIQSVIDAPTTLPGDLILVPPGTYQEMVIMHKPVRLQGWGARSTIIDAVKRPTEKLQAWRDKVEALFTAVPGYLLSWQAEILTNRAFPGGIGDPLGDLPVEWLAVILGGEGAGVTVLAQNLPIDGVVCPPATARTDGGYGLQTESGQLRPNARIDGLTITGSDQAAGIEVNANACNVAISNNFIHNNSGHNAGGVKIGHPGIMSGALEVAAGEPRAAAADEPSNNERVVIAFNHISHNAGNTHHGFEPNGGGAIAIGTGASGYQVTNNFVAGNFTSGNGAGITHMGLSSGGTIDHNTVIFNEGFNQLRSRSGGGIFVGGREPQTIVDPDALTPEIPGLTPGAGHVTISNNLIQGNQAASGDGGGISLAYVNGQEVPSGILWGVEVFGNTIVNNVAGLAGGGIALQDAAHVHIFHNTIARNDSLAVAGEAFTPTAGVTDPMISTALPAGIVSRQHTPDLIAALGAGQPTFSNPEIVNSIVFQNRSFFYGPLPGGVTPPPNLTGPTYGLIPRAVSPYWDLGVLGGGAGAVLSPTSSVLTSLTGVGGSSNVTTAPQFVNSYFNGDRRQSIQFPEITTAILVPAAFDEGGNFIRPLFGPLTLNQITSGALYGDYHVTGGVNGRFLEGAGGLYPTLADVPLLLAVDMDGHPRTPRTAVTPHRGSDQAAALAGPAAVIPSITINDVTVTEGNAGTVALNFSVALSQATTKIVTVDYTTANGTATEFIDYAGTASTVSFAPGATVQTAAVMVVGDLLAEADETLFVNLTLPANATIFDGHGVGTIVNDDGPPISPTLLVAGLSVAEGDAGTTPMTFAVTLSIPNPGPANVTVEYSTSSVGGTAIAGLSCAAGVDYVTVGSTTTLTFLPGATTPTTPATVSVCGDTAIESNETFAVNLTNASANATIAAGVATGVIMNDDTPPAPIGLVAAFGFEEASGTTAIDAAGNDNPGTLGGGTATRVPARTAATAGRFGRALLFDGINDWVSVADAAALDLTTGMTLSAWVNPSSIAADWRTVLLKEDLRTAGVCCLSYGLYAADGGGQPPAGYGDTTAAASGEVVTRDTAAPITILPLNTWTHLAVTYNGTILSLYVNATLVDTSPLTGSLFASTGPLRIGGNGVWGEHFAGLIDEVRVYSGALTQAQIQADMNAAVVPSAPLPTLAVGGVSLGEGNAGTTPMTFPVTLSNPNPGPADVTVQYSTSSVGGTATAGASCAAGVDYVTVGLTTLTFLLGATTPTTPATVSVCGETAVEPNQTFAVNLTNASVNATIAVGAATGTIVNDDAVPTPTLSVPGVSIAEGNAGTTLMIFPVTLSNPNPGPADVTVQYSTSSVGGTAVAGASCAAGVDYVAVGPTTLTFLPGATTPTAPAAVSVCGETGIEPNETFVVNLTNASVNATIAAGVATGTIANDDVVLPPTPTLSVAGVSVAEGNAGTTPMTFAVTLSNQNPGPANITVEYSTSSVGGTAVAGASCAAGVDYVAVGPTTLTFLPGATTPTTPATVSVCGETEFEPNETFIVNLTNPSVNTTIAVGVATGTIMNDDAVVAFGFEEASGTTAIDTAGNDNPGTLGGGDATRVPARTAATVGRFGQALQFDGINDWVSVADAAALDLTTGMTLSAWVNPSSIAADWRTVLLKEDLRTAGVCCLSYGLYAADGGGQPPAGYGDTTTAAGAEVVTRDTVAPITILPLGTWTHLAVTYDGALLSLYVNGTLVDTSPLTGSLFASAGPLRIGGNGVWGEFYSGLIDEVRVYDRALTQAEIQADMDAPVVAGSSGPNP